MNIKDIIENITDPTQQSDFDMLQDQVALVMQSEDTGDIIEMLQYINSIITQYGTLINTTNPGMYEGYQKMSVMLSFKGFAGLDAADQEAMLQKRFLAAIQLGFDPQEIVDEYFFIYNFDDSVEEYFANFVKYLEQNTETLGNNSLEVEGKKYLPQIKFWLLDYSKFPYKAVKRGAIERLNYVNQSPNVRALTQVQRQNLMSILKAYDDFIAPERPLSQRSKNFSDEELELEDQRQRQQAQTPSFQPPPIDIQVKLNELRERTK